MELTWENALEWADKSNEDKGFNEPNWSWDCNFKLDFDGPLLHVNSRFYPPNATYGKNWDGTVSIYFLGEEKRRKNFECKTLEELRESVEQYVKEYSEELKEKILSLL